MMQHEEGEAAQYHPQPEHIGHEIRAEKLPWLQEVAHHAETDAHQANSQGTALQMLQTGLERVTRGHGPVLTLLTAPASRLAAPPQARTG